VRDHHACATIMLTTQLTASPGPISLIDAPIADLLAFIPERGGSAIAVMSAARSFPRKSFMRNVDKALSTRGGLKGYFYWFSESVAIPRRTAGVRNLALRAPR
jgi:hypothetical protein